MLLTPAAPIREALGFDDMVDITLAIEGALHAAEATLSGALDTDFRRTVETDEFFVREVGWTSGPHYETQLRLRHGLVTPGTLVSHYGYVLDTLTDEPGLAKTSVDWDRGVVKDVGTRFEGHYVSVTYQKGFELQEAPNTNAYVFAQVPTWLQELARIRALIEMENHPVMENAGIKQDTKMLLRQYDQALARRLRYMPLAILPL